jgi:hypothetical protein
MMGSFIDARVMTLVVVAQKATPVAWGPIILLYTGKTGG